ncbi:hypothetical protein C8R44DRAFT_976195 [Mycena epipterygia]|nr:hypothetical protein C8R44DRAFT_976195 [Mycena epipterygia]
MAFVFAALLSVVAANETTPVAESADVGLSVPHNIRYRPVLNARGFYATLQSAQAGALIVATSDSTFSFLGGIVLGNERLALYPGVYTANPPRWTCDTTPSGLPRIFTSNNSFSAAEGRPTFVESPIWRYDPVT